MVMEQGLKVFNGIYKRIYRSMSKEFQLLFEVDGEHLDLEKYMSVLDDEGMEVMQALKEKGPEAVLKFLSGDFRTEDMDIIPTAEPDMVAEVQRAMKAEALMAKVTAGLPINPAVVTKRMLEAEQHEDIEELLTLPEPQPDPELVLKEKELQLRGVEVQLDAKVKAADVALKNVQAQVLLVDAGGKEMERIHAQFMKEKEARTAEFDSLTQRLAELNADKDREVRKQAKGSTK
jgi:chaperonin GroES